MSLYDIQDRVLINPRVPVVGGSARPIARATNDGYHVWKDGKIVTDILLKDEDIMAVMVSKPKNVGRAEAFRKGDNVCIASSAEADKLFGHNFTNYSRFYAKDGVVVGAFDENHRIVGCARALSDGCSDAYIQDVVVDPEYRGQGIGSMLIKTLTDALRAKGVDWIALVGEPGTEGFYRKLQWQEKSGFTLWQLKIY